MLSVPADAALIDVADEKLVTRYVWYKSEQGYAFALGVGERILMHRLVMDAPDYTIIDHINGNRLDNRRCNLRIVTRGENSRNHWNPEAKKYGYNGVLFDKKLGKWVAFLSANKILGYFTTRDEAATAYDAAIELTNDKFLRRNFDKSPVNPLTTRKIYLCNPNEPFDGVDVRELRPYVFNAYRKSLKWDLEQVKLMERIIKNIEKALNWRDGDNRSGKTLVIPSALPAGYRSRPIPPDILAAVLDGSLFGMKYDRPKTEDTLSDPVPVE